MSNRYSVIDMSRLGEMNVIEPSDAEAILARRMETFKQYWTMRDPPFGAAYDVERLEFDPAKIHQEVGTTYQVNLEARVNAAARATTLAFASGSDLDAIATRYPGGVPRLARVDAPRPFAEAPEDWESDDRYRRRIWLSPNTLAAAGTPEAYQFWALTAVPAIRDVSVVKEFTSEGPTAVLTCLREGADPRPTTAELLAVHKAIHQPGIKPLTDVVSVRPPRVIDVEYRADLWLLPGPDGQVVLNAVNKRLAAYLEDGNWLGVDHTVLAYSAALSSPGVHSAERMSPAADIIVDDYSVVRVIGAPTLVLRGRRS